MMCVDVAVTALDVDNPQVALPPPGTMVLPGQVDPTAGQDAEQARIRKVILQSMADAAHSGPVRPGPRGGVRWTPRWFARRSAWHVLDHAWEIEDRAPA